MNTVYICYISSIVFQEIKYNSFYDLKRQLKLLIIYHDSDIFITLLINNNILSRLNNYDIITIVFNQKKRIILFM